MVLLSHSYASHSLKHYHKRSGMENTTFERPKIPIESLNLKSMYRFSNLLLPGLILPWDTLMWTFVVIKMLHISCLIVWDGVWAIKSTKSSSNQWSKSKFVYFHSCDFRDFLSALLEDLKSLKMVQSGHSWCLILSIFHAWLFERVFEHLEAKKGADFWG